MGRARPSWLGALKLAAEKRAAMSSDFNLSNQETAPSSASSSTANDSANQDASSDQTVQADSPAVSEDVPQQTAPSSPPAIEALSEATTQPPTTASIEAEPHPASAAEVNATAVTTQTASTASIPPNPPAPASPPADPAIAERITIPGGQSNNDATSEGGEWDLLTAKIREWFDANDIGEQINRARQPLRLLAIFIGLLLILKVYSGLLSAIGAIPLAPRLLELVGLCSAISFSATRLVRSDERRQVIEGLRQGWRAFTGGKS